MNRRRLYPRSRPPAATGFTLVEMLVVMVIIALLVTIVTPSFSAMIQRARSVACSGNLRVIGLAATEAATDNNNTYPEIDQAAAPIYPAGSGAKGLYDALSNYGVTMNTLQCPVDLSNGAHCSFTKYGSSYEWNPIFDDETAIAPLLVVNGIVQIPLNSSRVRLCTDFTSLHNNRMNAVYGDGHVIAR